MRYAAAGVLIVLGIIVGLIGVAQKTIWAPAKQIVASAELTDPGSVIVVEPGVMNLYTGASDLTITHDGPIAIAQATKENVDAWVDKAAHTSVTGVTSETQLRTQKVDGDPQTPKLADADLFTNVQEADGTATVHWDQEAGRTSILISGDGEAPMDANISIAWPNNTETPWALPLIITGLVLILVGLLLAFLAYRRAKQEALRRKKRAERRRKLAEMGTAFIIVPGLALAGCGPTELPEPQPAAAPDTPGGVLTNDQLSTIVGKIALAVSSADEKTDNKALEDRATGPFLEQRQAAYDVKKKDRGFALPPAIATQNVNVNFTSATDTWPRVTTAVTSDDTSKQTQILVLSQENPRAPYKIWAQAVMLGGAEFPSVNDARQGSQLLDANAQGLALTPTNAVKNYTDILKFGGKSKFVDTFEDDAFRKQTADSQRAVADALKDGNATAKFDYMPGEQLIAQATADGSALVVGTATSSVTYVPENVDGRKGTLTIPQPQSDIVGKKETDSELVTDYRQVYAFIVPKGSGKARLIGLTSTMSGARLNDAQPTATPTAQDNG